jgi:dTDP-4-dehydrorhamnose reductase
VRRVLITGASGQLGAYLLRERRIQDETIAWSEARRGDLFGVTLRPVDLTAWDIVASAFQTTRPDLVIHAAALARVGDCYRQPDRARRVNTTATAHLTQLAAEAGVRTIFVSTDLVFDGDRGGYREEDDAIPRSIYGQTKRDAEETVLAVPGNAVVRLSLLFGPSLNDRTSFFDEQLVALRGGPNVTLFADEWRTPLDLLTAAQSLWAIALSDFGGLLHVGGPERLSRFEMGQRLAVCVGGDASRFVAARRDDVPAPEPRPRDASLDSSRWRALFPSLPWPKLEAALREMPAR